MSKRHFLLFVVLNIFAPIVLAEINRELVPAEAPGKLTLLEIKSRQVLIEWDPVAVEAVRGNFRGYLVRTWNHAGSQVYAFPPEITRASVEFFPFSKNFITVAVKNEKYVGPPSEAISFDAPQIEPTLPSVLNVFPLSNKSVLLQWTKPTAPNGILLGYKIYCREINDDANIERKISDNNDAFISKQIYDPDKLQAKLTGLQQGVRYRVEVAAINCAGESDRQHQEIVLEEHISAEPSVPQFRYKIDYKTVEKDKQCYQPTVFSEPINEDQETPVEYDYYDFIFGKENNNKNNVTTNKPMTVDKKVNTECLVDCMVLWLPNILDTPDIRYIKYRIKGEQEYQITEPEMIEDFIILPKFNSCKNYELVVVAVDGDFSIESLPVLTPTKI